MKASTIICFLGLVCGGCNNSSVGQEKNLKSAKTVALADSLERKGDIRRARDLYDEVLLSEPRNVSALFGKGQTYMTEGRWSTALTSFEKLLDDNPRNRQAHYLTAVCDVQIGMTYQKTKTIEPECRKEARQHLDYLIARDSLYKDVFNQYALLYLQEGNHEKAFELGNLQVRLTPHAPTSLSALFRLYRIFMSREPAITVTDYLSSTSTDVGRYFLAEWKRRHGELAEAENMFREMLRLEKLGIPRQALQLSLAKILCAQKKDFEAEQLFWDAVEGCTNPAESRLVYEDIKYIMSSRELDLFRRIDTSVSDQKVFFRVFWDRRKPDLLAAQNERLGEHYRRLVYAEENYGCYIYRKVLLPFYYMSSSFEDLTEPVVEDYSTYSINTEFDDRGLLYIRYGKPDAIYQTGGLGDIGVPPNLTWYYNPTDEHDKLIAEFWKISSEFNEWRFGLPSMNGRVLEDRIFLDPIYSDLLNPYLNRFTRRERMVTKVHENVQLSLATERHVPEIPVRNIDVSAKVTTFRASENKSFADIPYAIAVDQLAENTDTLQSVRLTTILEIRNRRGKLVLSKIDSMNLELRKAMDKMFTNNYRLSMAPDSYSVAFQVQAPALNSRGSWRTEVRMPDYSRPGLSMSDIEFLLPTHGRSTFDVEGIQVMPSPFERYNSNQTLHTYVQGYNLSTGVLGRSRCIVEFEIRRSRDEAGGVFAALTGIFKSKKSSLTLRFEKENEDATCSQYTPIVLGQFEAGKYELTVRLIDDVTNKSIQKSRSIEILGVTH